MLWEGGELILFEFFVFRFLEGGTREEEKDKKRRERTF